MNTLRYIWIIPAILLCMACATPALALNDTSPDANTTVVVDIPPVEPAEPLTEPSILPVIYNPPRPDFAWKSTAGWQNETIPITGSIDLSAFDSAGYPHIVSSNWSEGTVTYAWKDAAGWKTEPVPVTGYGSSIALDTAGEPHFTAYNWDTGGFSYVWRQNGVWQVEPVPDSSYADVIAYDMNGAPSMATYLWEDRTIRFTSRSPAGWQSENLSFSAIPSSLAIPADGIPRMIYTEDVYRTVPVVDIAPEGSTGETRPDIALSDTSSSSTAVIAQNDGVSEKRLPDIPLIGFAWKDASGWHNETIDSAGYLNTIAYSQAGDPSLLYGDGYSAALKYAWKDASGWHSETTPFSGYAYGLFIDASATIRTAYSDYTDGSLHYAYRDGSGWHDEPSGISYADTVQFDKQGNLHVLTSNWETGTVTYSVRTASGWQKEQLPYTGYAILFGTDPDGMPRMLYNGMVYYPLYYAEDGGMTTSGALARNGQVLVAKPQPVNGTVNTTPTAVPTSHAPSLDTKGSGAASGSLKVVSIPKGASVYIGTEKKGETPLVVTGIPAGATSVRLEMTGYDTWKKTFRVTKGKVTYSGKIVLTPSVIHTGTISVTTFPAGATVTIDGKEEGKSPLSIRGLSTGTHTVNLTLQGYPPWEKKVEVRAGKIVPLTRFLKGLAPGLKSIK